MQQSKDKNYSGPLPLVAALVVGTIVTQFLNQFKDIFHNVDLTPLDWVLPLLQVTIIAVLLAWMVSLQVSKDGLSKEAGEDGPVEFAQKSVAQFCGVWIGLWVSFLAYYIVSALGAFHVIEDRPQRWLLSACTAFQAAAQFLCFRVMDTTTTGDEENAWWNNVIWALITACGLSALGVLIDLSSSEFQQTFEGILALVTGVTLALFVGRLDSPPYVGTNRYIIAALYAYAVLQMTFPAVAAFTVSPDITDSQRIDVALIYGLALTLKVLLFYEVMRFIRGDSLRDYMLQHRRNLESFDRREDQKIST